MDRIVRKSLTNDFPMVRKQAVSVFSLLTLRCLCALSGLAFKEEAFEKLRDRAEQIQETLTKCREIMRCVAEALRDPDVRVVAECCKSLYMLIEENNSHIYSKVDEGFNYHTSEEAKEVLLSPCCSRLDAHDLALARLGSDSRRGGAAAGADLQHRVADPPGGQHRSGQHDRGHLRGAAAGHALQRGGRL